MRARLMWHLDRREYASARAVLAGLVQPGDVVLDIGANWGLLTDRLARRVGEEGRVVAFEPNPAQLPTLRAIAARHPNVRVHPLALSDAEATVRLHVPVSPPRKVLRERTVHAMATVAPPGHRRATAYETAEVAARRLDAMVDEGVVPREVTFVKCDVEGHELAVLRGAQSLLRESRPTILMEIEQRHQERPIAEVFELLRDLGYDGYALDHTTVRPLSDFDVRRDQLAHLRPNALFSAPSPGYLFEFLFVPAGAAQPRLGRGRTR